MKFLKSLLAIILVIAMVVPNITVFAANQEITLEQVKKYYPNMGYVDTYYYGGKEAYGDSTKAYKCYYLENKNTTVDICFFKNNVLETNKSIVEKLTLVYYANTFNDATTFEPFSSGLAETAMDYSNLNLAVEVSKYLVTTGTNYLLTQNIGTSLKNASKSFLTGLAEDISSTVLNGCILFMHGIADEGLDAYEYVKSNRNTSYAKTTTGAKQIADNIDIMFRNGRVLIQLAQYLIVENSNMNALDYLKSVGQSVMNSVFGNAPDKNDKLVKFAIEVLEGTDFIEACGSYISILDAFPEIKRVYETYTADSYSNSVRELVVTTQNVICQRVGTTPSTPSPSNNTVGSMTSSSSKSTYTTDEKVVITWTQATNATRYGLTIVNNATNEKVVNASNFTGTSYTVGKLPAGTYRFNMCGYNSNGSAGPVSAIKEFAVKSNSDNASSGSNYSTGTYKCTSSNGLNMRSGPSTSYSAIQGAGVYYNSTFVVTKVSGNWGYTTFNGASGWVCLDYATYISSSTTSPSVGNTDKNATGFVKYVNGRVGESFRNNLCQAFVWECINNYFGINATRPCATEAWKAFGKSSSKTDIPLGAIVYFGGSNVTCTNCKQLAGYVGIYVGNNEIVHAWNGIQKNTIDWVLNRGYTYRGWGWNGNYEISQPTDDNNSKQDTNSPIEIAPEYKTITEGTYVLNCIVKTYRYLTAKTDSNGGQVEAKPFENIDAQKFEIVKSGNGYKIVSKNSSSGRVVSGYNDGAGQTIGNVTLANPSNSSSQVWLFRKEGDCYVIYPSFNTSLALTSASTGRVVVSTYTGNDDQLWKLSLQNEEPKEYTVTYNANGGTDVPDKQIKTEGDSIRIASEEPTRNGYEFLGWSTSKNGDVEFESGDKYTDDKNITLYAVWEEIKTYTIKYNANGGSGAPSSQTKSHGESIKISTQKPTRSGYEFDGWATSANGDVEYSPSEHYTKDGDITLYAIWKVNTYTIRYNANGGIGAPKNQTKKYAKNINISTQEPTRKDYIFLGWSTSAQGSVEFAPGSVCSVNENITLYALWQEEENEVYYIIYNANGGKNAPSMQTKNEDEDITISEVVPTREGYTFDGWAIGDDDTVVYSSGDTYKENKTLYLHAVWTANTYTISYDANGGFGAPRNQSKIHDENITLSAVVPEKEDCMFIGWSDNPDAEYAEYYAEDIFAENSDTVLYAVWEEIVEEDEHQNQKEIPFEDVPEDAWYRKDVENAYKNGLINGKSEKRYAPNDNMTYAEAIKLACTIYQLYYDGEVTLTNGSDVWYSTYMDYALENRIVRTDYSSVANEYVTRKEFVNIFYGALPLKEFARINNVEDNIIPDVKIGDAYSGEIYTFYRAGILTGNDAKGTFKPDSNISRSEVAAIVTRMLDSGARKYIDIN